MAPQGAHLPSGAVLYNSRGRSPENPSGRRSRSRTEPLAPRAAGPAAPSTLAAKPRQPSGIQPSADSSSKAHCLKYRTQQKSTNDFSLVLFQVNQQLPILPGRFQPSTFGVCELNYRVRHGYGCILTAIATESLRVCTLKTV